jgi:hypothetical protein
MLAHKQQQQQGANHPTHWPEAAAAFNPDAMTWQLNEKLLDLMKALARDEEQQQQVAAALSRLDADKRGALLQQLQSLALSMVKVLASSSTLRSPDDCASGAGYAMAACLELPGRLTTAGSSSSSQAAASSSNDGDERDWQGWEHGSEIAAVSVSRSLVLTSRLLRRSLGDDSSVLGSISMGLPSIGVVVGGVPVLLWLHIALMRCKDALLALGKSQTLAAAGGGAAAAAAAQCGQLGEGMSQQLAKMSDTLADALDKAMNDEAAGSSDEGHDGEEDAKCAATTEVTPSLLH